MPPADVIALFGPTGVGKTDVAIALAERLSGLGERPVAVSADALQVYDGLQILTGAADPAQQARLEHRLLGFLPADQTFSVGRYAELAHAEIDGLLATGSRPIVVGGTGLYLRAALTELQLRPAPAPGVREHWTARLQALGPQPLHAELARRAPWAAESISPADRQRIVRALELSESGALEPRRGESELWTQTTRHPTLLVGVMMDRALLYERIDARVDALVAAGAADEVRSAAAVPTGISATARKAVGFEELLAGDIEAMKRRTRSYARRQLTWMRKLKGAVIVDATGQAATDVADQIVHSWRGHDG